VRRHECPRQPPVNRFSHSLALPRHTYTSHPDSELHAITFAGGARVAYPPCRQTPKWKKEPSIQPTSSGIHRLAPTRSRARAHPYSISKRPDVGTLFSCTRGAHLQ
jgi:hypothetical protein